MPNRYQVAHWPPSRLRASGRNPRTHGANQVAQIVRSVETFGWTNPVLAAPDGEIIAGEARWQAARQLGLEAVPVIVLEALSPAQRSAYRIADNRIALNAGWNEALLAEVLDELARTPFDLTVLGFGDAEIDALMAPLVAGAATPAEADRAEMPPAVPVTQPGDRWQLGPHRLVCGDSTRRETLAQLFEATPPGAVALAAETPPADLVFTDPPYGMGYEGGRARRQADLVFTDPPYGMRFGAGKAAGSTAKGATVKAHGAILGDDAEGEALVSLVAGALGQAIAVSRPGAASYVCLTWRTYGAFEAALQRVGLAIAACIVWDKGSIGLGHQHYRPQHEFIFYCRGDRWNGGKAEGDVWQLSRGATGAYVHPTQKPVALIERALRNSSRRGDVVLDLFGGSGSTLIACERLGRTARLIELDPKYCDAIVRRWEVFTGRKAERNP